MTELDTKVAVLETNLSHLASLQTTTTSSLERLEEGVGAIRTRVDQWNGSIPKMAGSIDRIEKRDETLVKAFIAQQEQLSILTKLPDKVTSLEKFESRANLIFSALGTLTIIVLGLIGKILIG